MHAQDQINTALDRYRLLTAIMVTDILPRLTAGDLEALIVAIGPEATGRPADSLLGPLRRLEQPPLKLATAV